MEAQNVPSPEPAPEPIVMAENYNKYRFIIENNENQVNIELKINDTDRYSNKIMVNGEFWNNNKRYFQEDIELFANVLNRTLIEKTGELQYTLAHRGFDKINIQLKCEYGLLSFNVDIPLIKILSENEELIRQVKILKQEISNIKHICGLDRSLKIKKINEKDIYKYCQYDFKKLPPKSVNPYSLVLINKTQFELIYTKKNLDRFPNNPTIPINLCACHTFDHTNFNCPRQGIVSNINCKLDYGPSASLKASKGIGYLDLNFNGTNHDIEEFFKMEISLPRMPTIMKLEHINYIEFDINKLDGFYIITFD